MAMVKRTMAEWQKKTKEVKRKSKQEKMKAQERGEEIDSDDDDDEEEDDEVVVDTEWGDLGSEDALIGTHSSMQGPFLSVQKVTN